MTVRIQRPFAALPVCLLIAACTSAAPAMTSPTATHAPTATPQPTPTPAPTATVQPLASTLFTSTRYAYTIEIPGDWTIAEPAGVWSPPLLMLPQQPGVDTFVSKLGQGGDIYDGVLFVSMTRVPAGTTEAAWAEQALRPVASHCSQPKATQDIALGDRLATMTTYQCPSTTALDIPLLVGDRGYLIAWTPATAQSTVEPILATFASTAPPSGVIEVTMTAALTVSGLRPVYRPSEMTSSR